jgi:hypothetical protein
MNESAARRKRQVAGRAARRAVIRPCEQRQTRGRIVARFGDLRLTPGERVAPILLRT